MDSHFDLASSAWRHAALQEVFTASMRMLSNIGNSMQVIEADSRVPTRRITEGQELPAMDSHFG